MDIRLKIYSTTTTWADTLDHTIAGGDIEDYSISCNANYNIDSARFKIINTGKKWSNQITADCWTGAAESTQVWRAFSKSNALLNSGIITRVYQEDNYLIIEGEGMSGLLKRRIINKQFFTVKDAAGTAIAADYILTNATYGLIPVYFPAATYGAIGTTNVTTPVTTEARVWRFDGITVWDAAIELAKASYGANNRCYDCYLYETFVAPATFAFQFYFKENESTASAKTITSKDVYINDYNIAEHSSQNYNRVIVRGEINPNSYYPGFNGDDDILTEDQSDWGGSSENYTTSVSGISPCLYYGAIDITRTDTGDRGMGYYDKSGTYTWDQRFHTLEFYARARNAGATFDEMNFYVVLGVKDKYGVSNFPGTAYEYSNHLYSKLSIGAVDTATNLRRTVWTYYSIPLPKPGLANNWYNSTSTFTGSGDKWENWAQIYGIGFILDDALADNIEILQLDGINFLGNVPYEGSEPTSPTTYAREYIYEDIGLKSDVQCNNMAKNILTGLNLKQYQGSIVLQGPNRDFTIKPGNTVEVVLPQKGLNIQAGQTPAKLGIQQINHSVNRQELVLGRVYSTEELINSVIRGQRRQNKVQ